MGIYHTSKEEAERLASRLREVRVGEQAEAGSGRTVVGYEVRPYGEMAIGWGIVERWQYDDRPDLGELGGAFVVLSHAKRWING